MSLISPFLIYYSINIIVEVIVISVMMAKKMPEIIQNQPSDPAQMSAYIMEEYMPYFMETFLKNIIPVTTVVALCAIPFFVVMFRKDRKYEAAAGAAKAVKEPVRKYPAIILLGITANIALNSLVILAQLPAYSEAYRQSEQNLYSAGLGIELIGLGIVLPVMEEFMFRGLFYKRSSAFSGKKAAITLSALVFAVYHGNFVQGIYGFIFGCLLAYLYEKYGSLKAPILLHITANLTSIFATEYGLYKWMFHDVLRMGIITVVCAAAAASSFVLIQKICTENTLETTVSENENASSV